MSVYVYVIVEHYDRGSDEVNIAGVFSTFDAAYGSMMDNFVGYVPLEGEDSYGYNDKHMPLEVRVLDTWHYADGDDSDDRVMIVKEAVR